MPKTIADVAINEMSLIYGEHKGETWQPVNADARLLVVKGGKKDGLSVKGSPGFIARLTDAVKAVFGPVAVDVDDDIDNDGDGADDYNAIACAVQSLSYDIGSAWGIGDAEARSVAVKCAIDNFLECLDQMRGMDEKAAPIVKGIALALVTEAMKAGRRHSNADQATIDSARDAHGKLGKALTTAGNAHAKLGDALSQLGSAQSSDDDETDDEKGYVILVADEKGEPYKGEPVVTPSAEIGEDGLPQSYSVKAETEEAGLAELEKAKTKKKPYGDVEYADPENGKYPIDTEEHIRAAWSYINMPKNAAKYSSAKLKQVKSKIRAAMKRIGADVEDDDKGAVVDSLSTVDVEKAIGEAVAAAMATAKGETQQAITDAVTEAVAKAKTESDATIAELRGELETANAGLTAANEMLKGIVTEARKPTSAGAVPTLNADGSKSDPAHETTRAARVEAVKNDQSLSPIRRVIAAQRAAQS